MIGLFTLTLILGALTLILVFLADPDRVRPRIDFRLTLIALALWSIGLVDGWTVIWVGVLELVFGALAAMIIALRRR